MKLLRPEASGFVRNIQTETDMGKGTPKTAGRGKRAVHEKDLFFWIPTNKIIEIKKNSQGITTDIHLASGTEFIKVNYTGGFKQSAKKQGLSKVIHHLEFNLQEKDILIEESEEISSRSMSISILHVNKYGDGFLYGERKGLSIQAAENCNMVLEGSEDNVFYEMTQECLKRVVPKTE